jgi:hypothetical protein
MITTLAVTMVLAQNASSLAPPPMVQSSEQQPFTPRFRFAVGSFTGVNTFSNAGSAQVPLNTGVLGISLRPGIQLTDRFGLEAEASYTSTWFFSICRAGGLADYTFNDHVTVGLGGVYGNNYARIFSFDQNAWPDTSRSYLAAVQRIDLHWFGERTEREARKAFTIGLELEEGASPPSGWPTHFPAQGGVGAYFTMGFRYW